MSLGIYTEAELRACRELVRALIRVVRSHRLYEGDHPTLADMHTQLRRKWDGATVGGPVSIRLTERRVLLGDEPVYEGSGDRADVLPTALYEHGVAGFILGNGVEPEEANRFVRVLAHEPGPAVDFPALLWDTELDHVQVLLDDDDGDDSHVTTPPKFADEMSNLGDPEDPVGAEQAETCMNAVPVAGLEFELSDAEWVRVRSELSADTYMATVCHAMRVVHAIAKGKLFPEEAAQIEKGLVSLVGAVIASGDAVAAVEITARARRMAASSWPLERRAGELALQTLGDEKNLRSFLRRLDHRDHIDPGALGSVLADVGASAAPTLADWLLETRHPDEVSAAMQVLGDAAADALVTLHARGGALGRERVGPVLLRFGTPTTIMALAQEFADLPEEPRTRLVRLCGRSPEPKLRDVLLRALEDPCERVRDEAASALRRTDAPSLTPILERFFERDVFEERSLREVEDFFEMLSRVGDRTVTQILAERCRPKGLGARLRGLTPLQELCARSLRRMRCPGAAPIVAELRRTGPRAVRQILESLG